MVAGFGPEAQAAFRIARAMNIIVNVGIVIAFEQIELTRNLGLADHVLSVGP